jgi:hypothetical protein
MLFIGRPSTGKMMLARRLPTTLPPLTPAEGLSTTRIYSALGRLKADEPLPATRPFRHPHHTISDAGVVGGDNPPAPGQISLARHGVKWRPNRSSTAPVKALPEPTSRRPRLPALIGPSWLWRQPR